MYPVWPYVRIHSIIRPWYQYLVLWLASNIPIGVPRYHWYTCTYAHVYVHVYVRTLSWLLQYWTQQATTVVRDTVYHYGTYVYGRVCYGHTSTYVRTYVTARAYVRTSTYTCSRVPVCALRLLQIAGDNHVDRGLRRCVRRRHGDATSRYQRLQLGESTAKQ